VMTIPLVCLRFPNTNFQLQTSNFQSLTSSPQLQFPPPNFVLSETFRETVLYGEQTPVCRVADCALAEGAVTRLVTI
jgi:hypothetical protein